MIENVDGTMYKNDQEGLKRGETGFCDVGCGAGL